MAAGAETWCWKWGPNSGDRTIHIHFYYWRTTPWDFDGAQILGPPPLLFTQAISRNNWVSKHWICDSDQGKHGSSRIPMGIFSHSSEKSPNCSSYMRNLQTVHEKCALWKTMSRFQKIFPTKYLMLTCCNTSVQDLVWGTKKLRHQSEKSPGH